MKLKPIHLLALSTVLLFSSNSVRAADSGQAVTLNANTQIPGTQLKPGAYTFAVEDRLPDRAIVRVTNTQSGDHSLVLAVPDSKLSVDTPDQLAYFKTNATDQKAIKAWKCADCSAPLEFVYPKLEAVKITGDSAETVMAVDPTYDKLPSNLSPDDMKVVTLWLLSPERITANNTGEGVKAAKYAATPAPVVAASSAQPATSPAPDSSTVASANTAPAVPHHRQRLPKTASNDYLYLFAGLAALMAGAALRWKRLNRA